ncbi:hypothetical protein ANCCEY_02723 [Ancylostoma ceylanicum]|uniref:Uncharacterized protein n=1 Tax=Ancylostoma ceylanicum TaxID=53326 RepID=A0A0D6M6X0_9BILA|nr:hypothetical protein ANCCEY_02723 [Ancylostoma ceylanicum]
MFDEIVTCEDEVIAEVPAILAAHTDRNPLRREVLLMKSYLTVLREKTTKYMCSVAMASLLPEKELRTGIKRSGVRSSDSLARIMDIVFHTLDESYDTRADVPIEKEKEYGVFAGMMRSVGRGCSSHFLTDDQHMHLGLGTHTKPSEVGTYLPADFDKLEIYEHWCFCATDYCNTQVCYSRPFGSSEFPGSYIGKRLQYSSYSSDWRFRNSCDQSMPSSLLLLLMLFSTVLV